MEFRYVNVVPQRNYLVLKKRRRENGIQVVFLPKQESDENQWPQDQGDHDLGIIPVTKVRLGIQEKLGLY
jgi:hypothetical protein